MIRNLVTRIAHKLLLAVGVAPKNVDTYRDAALAIPATIAVILAIQPLFSVLDGIRVTHNDIATAIVWLAVALGICALSPKWNEVSSAVWVILAFRGLIGCLTTRGDSRVVAVTLLFLVLASVCKNLKRGNRNNQRSLHHSSH
jgi:hypothetical protein